MRKYDYSFLSKELLPPELVNITNSISELKTFAAVRKDDYSELFEKLENIAKVQSVKSSNAIEGIVTTDKRIEQIVNESSAPLNHSEMEIAGYRDALSLIHQNFATFQFNERNVLSLHGVLLQYTGAADAGQYKKEDNVITETDIYGNRRVRYTPVLADETPAAMEQLFLAYSDAISDISINRLLLIPCVIADFLCIHPFRDGNGRMSRLLSLLLLYQAGFDVGKFISFEEQINNRKGAYYIALKEASEGWHDNANTYIPFVMNFISTLYFCYKELDKRFSIVYGQKISKKKRIEAAIEHSLLPISKKEICSLLPDVSVSTVEAVLAQMIKDKHIEKIGTNRNAKYSKI